MYKLSIVKCKICGKEFETQRRKTCSEKCANTHTPESKELISLKRKEWIKNNPDKHVWKRKDKFKSVPCETLKQSLRDNKISFVEEFSPIVERGFSVDIAFPDLKIGIEINGNQHYNKDGSLKSYYQDRHDLIEKQGWKLIEIFYTDAFNVDKIIELVGARQQPDYSQYFKDKNNKSKPNTERNRLNFSKNLLSHLVKSFCLSDIAYNYGTTEGVIKRIAKKYGIDSKDFFYVNSIKKAPRKTHLKREIYFDIVRKQNKEKEAENIEKVLNSNIDFSKLGWVTKVSKLINKKDQKINKWMKKYLPDFYRDNCFKRKSSAH